MTLSRREALRLAAAAAAAPFVPRAVAEALAGEAAAPAAAAPRFFGAAQMRLLDELVEAIIPEDAHSGGAREAGVAGYIDGRLAEYDSSIPDLAREREHWKNGLGAVDALAREATGHSFLEASPEERTALLTRLAQGETEVETEEPDDARTRAEEKPEIQGQRFFLVLKAWTAQGYYTSKVGIHDDMEYLGNTLLLEFAGTDVATLPPVPKAESPR